MAAIRFPSNPTNGQQYTAPGGNVYTFDGTKWVGAVIGNTITKIGLGTATISISTSNNLVIPNGASIIHADGSAVGLTTSALYNNGYTVALTTSGSVIFSDGTVQRTAFTGTNQLINGAYSVTLSNTGTLFIPGSLNVMGTMTYINKEMVSVETVTTLNFADNSQQTTAWNTVTNVKWNQIIGAPVISGAQGTTGGQGVTGSGTQGTAGSGTQGTTGAQGVTGAPASVNKTSGSWTLSTGSNTVSITVAAGGNYQMWVNGNIPNGIVTWNATVSTSNTNVPVVGSQYGWYYAAGNALVLTSMPNQIVGTAGSISTATIATTTANVFTFGITNNSTSSQVVNWGYTTL